MIQWVQEENYDSVMDGQVLPYLKPRLQTGYFERVYGIHPQVL